MGEASKIEWTDHTWNPWWGCQRVSPGCEHCYAETFSKRVGHGKRLPTLWGPTGARKIASETVWREPAKWNVAAANEGVRRRVFVASMADVFEDRPELEQPRARAFRVIENAPHLDFLILTKRPENMVGLGKLAGWSGAWPSNVWAGTTCEDQKRADGRLPHLLAVPARIRFVSYEPALEEVDFSRFIGSLDWIIVGGESGPGARPFDIAWAHETVHQCLDARVACFVKQMGAQPYDSNVNCRDYDDVPPNVLKGRLPEGVLGAAAAGLRFADTKGGDWHVWPSELRVRQFPGGAS